MNAETITNPADLFAQFDGNSSLFEFLTHRGWICDEHDEGVTYWLRGDVRKCFGEALIEEVCRGHES